MRVRRKQFGLFSSQGKPQGRSKPGFLRRSFFGWMLGRFRWILAKEPFEELPLDGGLLVLGRLVLVFEDRIPGLVSPSVGFAKEILRAFLRGF